MSDKRLKLSTLEPHYYGSALSLYNKGHVNVSFCISTLRYPTPRYTHCFRSIILPELKTRETGLAVQKSTDCASGSFVKTLNRNLNIFISRQPEFKKTIGHGLNSRVNKHNTVFPFSSHRDF